MKQRDAHGAALLGFTQDVVIRSARQGGDGLTVLTCIMLSSVYLASCDQYHVAPVWSGLLSPGLLQSMSTSSHDLCEEAPAETSVHQPYISLVCPAKSRLHKHMQVAAHLVSVMLKTRLAKPYPKSIGNGMLA